MQHDRDLLLLYLISFSNFISFLDFTGAIPMVKLHLPRKSRPLLHSGWKRCLTGWFVLKITAGIECRFTTRTCFPAWPVHWNPWDISHTRPRAQVSMNTTLTCLLKKAVRGSEEVMSEQLKIHARPKSRLILARYWYCFKEGKKLHAGGFSLLCMSCHIWNCLWTK